MVSRILFIAAALCWATVSFVRFRDGDTADGVLLLCAAITLMAAAIMLDSKGGKAWRANDQAGRRIAREKLRDRQRRFIP